MADILALVEGKGVMVERQIVRSSMATRLVTGIPATAMHKQGVFGFRVTVHLDNDMVHLRALAID